MTQEVCHAVLDLTVFMMPCTSPCAQQCSCGCACCLLVIAVLVCCGVVACCSCSVSSQE
jgi:hypothetical protein